MNYQWTWLELVLYLEGILLVFAFAGQSKDMRSANIKIVMFVSAFWPAVVLYAAMMLIIGAVTTLTKR